MMRECHTNNISEYNPGGTVREKSCDYLKEEIFRKKKNYKVSGILIWRWKRVGERIRFKK